MCTGSPAVYLTVFPSAVCPVYPKTVYPTVGSSLLNLFGDLSNGHSSRRFYPAVHPMVYTAVCLDYPAFCPVHSAVNPAVCPVYPTICPAICPIYPTIYPAICPVYLTVYPAVCPVYPTIYLTVPTPVIDQKNRKDRQRRRLPPPVGLSLSPLCGAFHRTAGRANRRLIHPPPPAANSSSSH